MLLLTRKNGESVVIANCIRVRVLSVRGGRVRLGIEAPRAVGVKRMESLRGSGTTPQTINGAEP